jgi:serine/threonine-protein kinase
LNAVAPFGYHVSMVDVARAGDIFAGKYRIERVLGEGGMGVVLAARHLHLDERVAIKFLLPRAVADGEAVARFLREARSAVRIKSEHVARVMDVGQTETGAPYMVMEYLDGSDLGALLRERGALPVEDAVDYVVQACEAIANAHVLGIIHRDLKPANLMLVRSSDGSPCVKVLDFGISKVTVPEGPGSSHSMTRTMTVMGSPSYMSPEQMISTRNVDARTDIWALGAILYELLTGKLPFEAETIFGLGVMIAKSEPAPIGTFRRDVPEGLAAVVATCLAKSRDDRFDSVAALAEALRPFAPQRSFGTIERASRIEGAAGQSPKSVASGSSPDVSVAPGSSPDVSAPRVSSPAVFVPPGSSPDVSAPRVSSPAVFVPPGSSLTAAIAPGASPAPVAAAVATMSSWGQTGRTGPTSPASPSARQDGKRSFVVAGMVGAAVVVVVGLGGALLAWRQHSKLPEVPSASVSFSPPPPEVTSVPPAGSLGAASGAPPVVSPPVSASPKEDAKPSEAASSAPDAASPPTTAPSASANKTTSGTRGPPGPVKKPGGSSSKPPSKPGGYDTM